MAPPPPRRTQSQDNRDLQGFAAKKDRERVATPQAVPIHQPENFEEELTGNYTGPDLAYRRAQRPTDKRLEKLETKQDELKERQEQLKDSFHELGDEMRNEIGDIKGVIGDLKGKIGEAVGQLAVLPDLVKEVRLSRDRAEERAAAQTTRDAVRTDREHVDTLDAKKTKRDTIAKVIGGILSGGLIMEIVRRLS